MKSDILYALDKAFSASERSREKPPPPHPLTTAGGVARMLLALTGVAAAVAGAYL